MIPFLFFIILLLSRGKAKLAKSEIQDSTKTFFPKGKFIQVWYNLGFAMKYKKNVNYPSKLAQQSVLNIQTEMTV